MHLLNGGADVMLLNRDGQTCLHASAMRGNAKVAELLREAVMPTSGRVPCEGSNAGERLNLDIFPCFFVGYKSRE